MTINVYMSTDAGAPTLSGTVGSFISLLDACLVNGYGSKAAAGWTKEYSGTNLAAYRMSTVAPATGFYLRVDHTGNPFAREVRVSGYETMSDINTGTGQFPSNVQVSGGLYLTVSSSNDSVVRPWCLIATNRSFYFFISPSTTVLGAITNNGGDGSVLFFGDIKSRKAVDGYECAIISNTGGWGSGPSFVSIQSLDTGYSNKTGHYIARDYTGLVSSVAINKGRVYSQINSGSGEIGKTGPDISPNTIKNSMDFAEIMIGESNVVFRGYLPGFYEIIGGANYGFTPYLSTLTGNGPMTGKNLMVVLIDRTGRGVVQTNGSWY